MPFRKTKAVVKNGLPLSAIGSLLKFLHPSEKMKMTQLNRAWERVFIFNARLVRDFHFYKTALKFVKNTYFISTESPTKLPTDPKIQRAARQTLTQFGQNSQEFKASFSDRIIGSPETEHWNYFSGIMAVDSSYRQCC